jgi:translocation and assembly module TamB
MNARLDLPERTLALNFHAAENGGLLAGLTGRAAARAFAIELGGAGPLADWRGDLHLKADGLASADAQIALALDGAPRVHLAATLDPAPGLLPAPAARLLGERVQLALTAVRAGPQQLAIEELRATAAQATLTGSGRIDLAGERVSARADLEVGELAPLGELVATPLAGSLELSADVDGPLLQPKGRLAVAMTDLAAGKMGAREVRTTFDLAALQRLSEPGARVQVALEGRAEGLRLPPEVPLPPQDVVWQGRLSAPVDGGGTVTVERLTMTADHLTATTQGTLDAATLAGEAQLALTVDALAPFAARYGQPVEGTAELQANLAVGAGAEVISIDLYGGAHELRGLPAGLAELLGPVLTLEANAVVVPDDSVELTHLRVEGAAATLDGRLDLGLPAQTLDGALSVDLANLAPLSPLLGLALDGPLSAQAQLGGTILRPAIELAAQSPGLLIAGEQLDTLTLAASVEGTPEAADGEFRLAATAREVAAELAAAVELRRPRLRLSDVRLNAPRTRAGGNLSVDLDRRLVEGELTGRVEQLRELAALLPAPLAGALEFEARASAKDGAQGIDVTARTRDLAGAFGRLGQLELRGGVADALNAPRVHADLTLNGFDRGEVAVSEGSIRAEGTPQALNVRMAAAGQAQVPFDFEARAGVALGDRTQVRIEQLNGRLADQPLRLVSPATLSVARGSIAISDLNLRLGEARVAGAFDLRPQQVAAEATLEQLPLALLGRFGAPEVSGRLGGRLSLRGAADNPSGSLRLEATDVALPALASADMPPARLALSGELAGRRLRLELRGEGVSEQPIRAQAELPLVIDLAAGAFEVPADGQVAGSLAGELSLARLADIAGLDDQRLEGPLIADLRVGGTVARPAIEGTVRVEGALYENGTTGTVLRDLSLLVEADRQTLAIRRFSATDGGAGRLNGEGTIGLDRAAGYPLDVRVQFERARLVARDDATATLSGRVALAGNVAAPKLKGEISVDRADVSIPERLGPRVAVLPVEEVGMRRDARQTAGTASTRSEFALGLDLTVAMASQGFVRGRGLDSEWQGRVRVEGTTDQPRATGTLDLRRGTFTLLGRRFDLRRGVITFTGASPPRPMLDIEAVARSRDITAVIRITGDANAPVVALDSEPPLPQDEILARVLFNRSANQLGPGDAVELAAAINTLRGGPEVLGRARQALGVDTLGVSGQGLADGRVTAGKYLNDRVFVEVGKGAAADSENVRLEVELLPNLSLDARANTQAQSGVGLRWRFDY